MKKIFKTIYLTILTAMIIAGGLLTVNPVQADGNILVEIWNKQTNDFEALGTNPIFDVSNFLPGGTETERLKVINKTAESQKVGLNVTDFDEGCVGGYYLSKQLILTIIEFGSNLNDPPLYSDSLFNFYNYDNGEIYLSEVAASNGGINGEVQYDFSVHFNEIAAAKEYQNSTTSFNLEIGFLLKQAKATGGSSRGFNFINDQDEDDANAGVVKGAEDKPAEEPEGEVEGEEIGILPKVGPYFPWICLLALVIFGITLKTKRSIDF